MPIVMCAYLLRNYDIGKLHQNYGGHRSQVLRKQGVSTNCYEIRQITLHRRYPLMRFFLYRFDRTADISGNCREDSQSKIMHEKKKYFYLKTTFNLLKICLVKSILNKLFGYNVTYI
ncbi:hypothetical protein PUN28_018112 [Cardiocondyla obscurior]|uniref:Uncharacterized protein n=1 Tax=Cardiocondyla obscurior TaxID=286306 RepID=A0AAW2EJN6_9HYME